MYTHPFFEATPPSAAPGPPVKTGARVRQLPGVWKKGTVELELLGLIKRNVNKAPRRQKGKATGSWKARQHMKIGTGAASLVNFLARWLYFHFSFGLRGSGLGT